MPSGGERSGRMMLWVLNPDVVAFGTRLHAELGDRAVWRKNMPGLRVEPASHALHDLIDDGWAGARLQLASGGPIIQLLVSRVFEGKTLRSGELAFRWAPAEHSRRQQQQFTSLARLTFSLMRAQTLPSRVLRGRTPDRAARIGKVTYALAVQAKALELRDASAPLTELKLRQP